MKKTFLLILFSIFILSAFTKANTIKRIKKYSGKHATELKNLYKKKNENRKYYRFLLDNCSPNDLATLRKNFIIENTKYALESRKLSYANYSDKIFLHFVLPHRIAQEPLQNWRKQFYDTIFPKVKDCKTIEEAIILVNLWVTEQMTYKSTNGRDQAPLTTIKRGYGRCEESMILFIAALRSVGIPSRPASVPFWNFTDNNHAWVEVWTPTGWKYVGEVENSLNKAWFSKTTERATLITAEAFGNYDSPNTIKQKNNVTYLSSIEYYTKSRNYTIFVKNIKGKPVKKAKIYLYAASYGGLFGMTSLETDKKGKVHIPLGRGTVYVTASKDGKFASSLLNTMDELEQITLVLKDNKKLDENIDFKFPLPVPNDKSKKSEEILGDKFDLMRDNANLIRKDKLAKQKKAKEFVKYYDTVYWNKVADKNFKEQKEFLDKTEELAGNTYNYLKVFRKFKNDNKKTKILVDMILEWDTKELVETPDSSSIYDIVTIYSAGKQNFAKILPDSLFRKNVIHRTWRSAIPPENGWEMGFYHKIKNLKANNLKKTVKNVIKWVDKEIKIEKDFQWSYFSGSLNPNEILLMKNIPEFYRTKLINSALKQLGVPLKWKGKLEFYNGEEFEPIEKTKDTESDDIDYELTIDIFVDNEQVKAEEWKNFLISKLDDNGEISYTFFEGENDSLSYKAKYHAQKDDEIYLEASVRNGNGDANIIIKSLSGNEREIRIDLHRPREYADVSQKWDIGTVKSIQSLFPVDNNTAKIIFVIGKEKNEPEERMYLQILDKLAESKKKNIKFVVASPRESIPEYIKSSEQLISQDFLSEIGDEKDFPIIFVLNKKNELIFSSKGYNMGIANLIFRKIKKAE